MTVTQKVSASYTVPQSSLVTVLKELDKPTALEECANGQTKINCPSSNVLTKLTTTSKMAPAKANHAGKKQCTSLPNQLSNL